MAGNAGDKRDRAARAQSADDKLRAEVHFLGGFTLRIGDAVITDELNRSTKLWTLLGYMIIHRERTIPQSEFIELLWPDDERDGNPLSALKALFFRVRRMLGSVFGDLPLIVSHHSTYSWNRDIECTVDCEGFEALCRQAADFKLPQEQRMQSYREAVPLYKGDFLPKMSAQLWSISFITYYHNLYMDAVKDYAALLHDSGQYRGVCDLCLRSIPFDSFDEDLHIMLMRGLLAQGQYASALGHYESTTEHLYRNLGVQPSKEMQGLYREIMNEQEALETDLTVIQQALGEEEFRSGAYYCEFGFFREAYRINARLATRTGMSIHIVLFTLLLWDGRTPELDKLNDAMDALFGEIQQNLRRVDIFSRYSNAQYLLMLPRANYEDSTMVSKRIVDAFAKLTRFRKLRLVSKIQQLELGQNIPAMTPKEDAANDPQDRLLEEDSD